MEIRNQFEVPLTPAEAWAVLLDIRRIVPCVPGAELIERVDERTYKGKVQVRLGPVALAFVGTAQFEELDEASRRARVVAKGSDAKGRGGANAAVTFRLEPSGEGTKVVVETGLTLSGSVAQYGRASGIIQGVATQLTAQFAQNLRAMLAEEGAGALKGPVEPLVSRVAVALPATIVAERIEVGSEPATLPTGATGIEALVARAEAAASRIEVAAIRVEAALARAEAATTRLSRNLAPAPRAKPISGFALMLSVLWNALAGLFRTKRDV